MRKGITLLATSVALLWVWPGGAEAAAPQIISVSVVENSVTATGVTLFGSVDPNGSASTYHFEFLPAAAFEANLEAQPPRQPFAGAMLAPPGSGAAVGAGTSPVTVSQHIGGLAPATSFRYRLRVVNAGGEAVSVPRPFATEEPTNVSEPLDGRGWEMVSPIEKDGGAVQAPGAISGGGVFQAAAGGGSFTFSSADSFGLGAVGAPSGSQYLATRDPGGWNTANITTPLLSGSYGSEPDGVPYQLFSGDLGLALLSNGERCRGMAGGACPVANPPLAGSGAPAGYRDYYRRSPSGGFESILTSADLSHTAVGPEQFELRLVGTSADLSHIVLSSCAALTVDATEVAAPSGCDPAAQNLYEWSGGTLTLVNRLPGEATGTPGAAIAAPGGAVSEDGGRIYWTEGGNLYLTDRGETEQVDELIGGGEFQTASTDGSVAYLIKAGQLYRYSAAANVAVPLAASGQVEGVLGGSADGSTVYYATTEGLFVTSGAVTARVAATADPSDWPPATGTARVTADGRHLLFLSTAELTGYPNEGETEAFLYGPPPGGTAPVLVCVSCNPTGERPQGPATIPGARPNGTGPGAVDAYRPRVLTADGERAFFESVDSLVPQDTNSRTDVYEWEAAGEGTCTRVGGCVQLISGGRDTEASWFLDADADGENAFFLTAASLYPLDPGSYDVYDARVGGGFAAPESPVPCVADACQVLPEAPEDPTPGTLVPSSGNPPLTVTGTSRRPGRHKKKPKKAHRHKGHRGKKTRHNDRKRAKGAGRRR